MEQPVFVVDEIETVVKAVDAVLFATLQKHIIYLYGHPLEIVNRLQKLTNSPQSKDKKYPLVALFTDFRVNREQRFDMYGTTSLNIIIATLTQPDYYSEDRMAKNFKPILYPIYVELLNQLAKSKAFFWYNPDEIAHTEIDRLYWGKEGLYGKTGNIFNDFIDAIEIQNLSILINNKICSPPKLK
jgi:hypothetical protein